MTGLFNLSIHIAVNSPKTLLVNIFDEHGYGFCQAGFLEAGDAL